MQEKEKFYITTTLPYVNAKPHMGHALEFVQADVLARYQTSLGKEVFFNTGTDEHGQKIYEKALEEKKNPQNYCDEYAEKFKIILNSLTISPDAHFIRTTDAHHISAAQEFWRRCEKNGDIYKKLYAVKYCVGCELEKTDSELNDEGKCPIHPNLSLEHIEEENYFFRFSKYQKPLLELYTHYPDFVVPSHRLTEIKNFVSSGLEDFSISRLASKMPWGIPVPGDVHHIMYVWFDALINYISTLGWPENESVFADFWGDVKNPCAIQIAGKDNLRQQSAMWQAMLLSAGLPTSRQIFIHGFVMSGGQKMSKSLGNVVDPLDVVAMYGVDALRYYLLREIPAHEDGDFTLEKLRTRYDADLANGLGNFVSRVTTLAEQRDVFENSCSDEKIKQEILHTEKYVEEKLNEYKFNEALSAIWDLIGFGDKYISEKKPWAITNDEEKNVIIEDVCAIVCALPHLLAPFLSHTAEKIEARMERKGARITIKKCEALFPRLS